MDADAVFTKDVRLDGRLVADAIESDSLMVSADVVAAGGFVGDGSLVTDVNAKRLNGATNADFLSTRAGGKVTGNVLVDGQVAANTIRGAHLSSDGDLSASGEASIGGGLTVDGGGTFGRSIETPGIVMRQSCCDDRFFSGIEGGSSIRLYDRNGHTNARFGPEGIQLNNDVAVTGSTTLSGDLEVDGRIEGLHITANGTLNSRSLYTGDIFAHKAHLTDSVDFRVTRANQGITWTFSNGPKSLVHDLSRFVLNDDLKVEDIDADDIFVNRVHGKKILADELIADAVVFLAGKAFAQLHPTDPSKMVKFITLEGPEHGVYWRTSGRLVEGEAIIEFPEGFTAALSTTGPITAQATLTADANGLFIAEKTPTHIVLRETGGGTSEATFDLFVQGERLMFEGWESIQPRDYELFPERMAFPGVPIPGR